MRLVSLEIGKQMRDPLNEDRSLAFESRRLPPSYSQRGIDRNRHKGDQLMHFIINGEPIDAEADIRTSLLDLLRNCLGQTGTKKGCDQGACGACTVLVDGERINSCLALAVQYQGRSIVTVEGLAQDGQLHPLQQAFVDHDGFQCGYCTPGQLCSAIGMAAEIGKGMPSAVTIDLTSPSIALDEIEIRERMSGNLCRCGAYNGIVEAISEAFSGGNSSAPREGVSA